MDLNENSTGLSPVIYGRGFGAEADYRFFSLPESFEGMEGLVGFFKGRCRALINTDNPLFGKIIEPRWLVIKKGSVGLIGFGCRVESLVEKKYAYDFASRPIRCFVGVFGEIELLKEICFDLPLASRIYRTVVLPVWNDRRPGLIYGRDISDCSIVGRKVDGGDCSLELLGSLNFEAGKSKLFPHKDYDNCAVLDGVTACIGKVAKDFVLVGGVTKALAVSSGFENSICIDVESVSIVGQKMPHRRSSRGGEPHLNKPRQGRAEQYGRVPPLGKRSFGDDVYRSRVSESPDIYQGGIKGGVRKLFRAAQGGGEFVREVVSGVMRFDRERDLEGGYATQVSEKAQPKIKGRERKESSAHGLDSYGSIGAGAQERKARYRPSLSLPPTWDTPDFHELYRQGRLQEWQSEVAAQLGIPVIQTHSLKAGIEGPEMVLIPPGRFLMGSRPGEPWRYSDGGPQHEEIISEPYWLGRYAVTFKEYDYYCEVTGASKPEDEGWGRGQRPVINVSWYDAVAYCQWLSEQAGRSYRLPTEAEWEMACRAGTQTAFSFGNELSPGKANYNGSYVNDNKGLFRNETVAVDKFGPNTLGLHQMHGNVREWCTDRHLSCGGSWVDQDKPLRSSYRCNEKPDNGCNYVGFRLSLASKGAEGKFVGGEEVGGA